MYVYIYSNYVCIYGWAYEQKKNFGLTQTDNKVLIWFNNVSKGVWVLEILSYA